MRTAVIIVSLIASAVAEAPYHLPRPGPHAPSFNYQPAPAPLPLRPQPQPQPNFAPNSGYHYQAPSIQPAFVHPPQPHYHPQPAPQPHYRPQPAPQPQYIPQPQPQYIPQPAPQPQPHFHPQPAPQPNYIPNSGYHYQQPSIQPAFIQPQPQPIQIYNPAPQPQPLPVPQPQPLPVPQPQIPSTSYGIPQPQIARPLPQPAPIPAYIAPQPAPAPAPAPVQVNFQQNPQQGYSYSQPSPQFPLQSVQPYISSGSSGLSSYQADSAQYSGSQAQTHGEALDSVVVDKVQNIIKESEHSSARDAGYLSLVSGVSLENARPSVEISSFVQTAPLSSGSGSVSVSQGPSSADSTAVSAPSGDYGLPVIQANSQSSQSGTSSIAFLPDSKPATAYGPPN